MKLHSLIFSPTGTSARIADAVMSGIAASMGQCEINTIDTTLHSDTTLQFGPDDAVIIAAPVYGGKMAPIAKQRMAAISALSTPCVLIAVYGNRAFENALNDMDEFARNLGFIPVTAGAFIGEHSYSTAATPIAVGRPDATDLQAAKNFGEKIGAKLSLHDMTPADTTALHDQPSPQQSLDNFRNFVIGYQQQQKETPKQYLPVVDTDICSECGECVSVCPTSAISDDCREVDASKCIKCCACVKSCPEGARSLFSPFAPVLSENFNSRKSPVWAL